MALGPLKKRLDVIFFAVTLLAYIAGQFLIGTYSVEASQFLLSAPSDADFLYYAGIIKQMQVSFPPQNPAFGGIVLGQSFFQYYPVALVSLIINVYWVMKIFNVLYLLVLAALLRRYFSVGWGMGLIFMTAAAVGSEITNALGIDLIARGFNHFPFFILATIGLFEKKQSWRHAALFFLPLMHTFLGFLFVAGLALFLIVRKFDRHLMRDVIFCTVGFIPAILLMLGGTDKPLYELLTGSYGISFQFIWSHALVATIMIVIARDLRLTLIAVVSLIVGTMFHYYSFFPVFMLNFMGGLAAIKVFSKGGRIAYVPAVMALLLFVGFNFTAVEKYGLKAGNYYPHIDHSYRGAADWLDKNSPGDAVILALPMNPKWSCRLMEERAIYLGLVQHVATLGIAWEPRGQEILDYYSNPQFNEISADYVIWGPDEKQYFPGFKLYDQPLYEDKEVTIWKINSQ